jgi:hypothetical protein
MRTGLFIILLSSVGASAAAQTVVDHRVWGTAIVQGHFQPKSKWRWSVEGTIRSKNGVSDLDTIIAPRALVGYDLTPKLNVWGGYGEITKFNKGLRSHEHRYFEQLTWTAPAPAGTFTFRTRVEQRDVDGNDHVAIRVREQARYTHPFAPKSPYSLIAYDEIFVHTNATAKYARGFDQNRVFAGVGRAFGSRSRLEMGYVNHYGRTVGQPNFVDHVLQTTLTVSF